MGNSGWREGGNWRCWDPGQIYTYERCCIFWPGYEEDWVELPKHREPFLHFGLRSGQVLTVAQGDREAAVEGGRRKHDRSGGLLWRGGAALARWADDYVHLWSDCSTRV